MLSSRFGRDTAAPLGGVDLGGTHPPLMLERGAQLTVLGFEFPEPLGRVVALARHGRQHPRVTPAPWLGAPVQGFSSRRGPRAAPTASAVSLVVDLAGEAVASSR